MSKGADQIVEQSAEQKRIDTLERSVEALRGQLRASRASLARERRSRAAEDKLFEAIAQYERDHDRTANFEAPDIKQAAGQDHYEHLLLFSDSHFGEFVDPKQAQGIAYNKDICLDRIRQIRDAVLSYGRKLPAGKLTVALLGDLVSGNIHDELRETNDLTASQGVVLMAHTLDEMITDFRKSGRWPDMEIVCLPGNHGRLHPRPRTKQKTDNFDWLIGRFLQVLGHRRYSVTCPSELVHMHQVFDWNVALTHGDGIKVGNSYRGVPFYGLCARMAALQKMQRTLNKPPIEILSMGHLHTVLWDREQGICVNGSIIGCNDYSLVTRYAATPPCQLLQTWHKTRGMIALNHIYLT